MPRPSRSFLGAPAVLTALALLAGGCGAAPPTRPVAGQAATLATPASTGTAPGPSVTAARPPTPTPPPTTTTEASTPLAAPRPPFPITETTLPLVDTSRPTVSDGRTISASRALTTLVWAPVGGGRWPLVVWAHGFQVGPAPYVTLLEAWAAAGYVVAAPEFPLTDQAVAGANLDENDIDNQPADLRFVTDSLVAPASPVAARIDRSRVGVAGHSDGAETALAASIAPAPAGTPAYRAVIAMSVSPLIAPATTANPPILVTQGDADTINAPNLGVETWDRAASPKYLDVLHGAGHLPPLEAGSAWLPGIEALTLAFLDYYVAGDGPESAITIAGKASPALATLRTG